MSFSMAARPVSLMLQQRQPLANSRNSEVVVEAEEMVIDFACKSVSFRYGWEEEGRTFYILNQYIILSTEEKNVG